MLQQPDVMNSIADGGCGDGLWAALQAHFVPTLGAQEGGQKGHRCTCARGRMTLLRDHLPPLAVAAVWAPPAMLPWTEAPSPASSPTRRSWGPAGWRTRAGGRPPRRLRFALCCRKRHGQAERHCPAGGIAD